MSNYNQLQKWQRDEIQKVILNEREKMQGKIDKNSKGTILNKIKQLKGESMNKCQFCKQKGIHQDILNHMKNSQKEDFMMMEQNIDKYSKCRVCKKLIRKKNIEEYQLKCEIKEDNRIVAREMKKVENLKRRNQYCLEINDEEEEEEYNYLLKEFGISTEVNPKHINQSQESNYSRNELMTSILNSEIFKTKKKLKTNEEREDNQLKFQTLKKIPLKQPKLSQNDSFINELKELNLNNNIEDQEIGYRTKKKQHSQ